MRCAWTRSLCLVPPHCGDGATRPHHLASSSPLHALVKLEPTVGSAQRHTPHWSPSCTPLHPTTLTRCAPSFRRTSDGSPIGAASLCTICEDGSGSMHLHRCPSSSSIWPSRETTPRLVRGHACLSPLALRDSVSTPARFLLPPHDACLSSSLAAVCAFAAAGREAASLFALHASADLPSPMRVNLPLPPRRLPPLPPPLPSAAPASASQDRRVHCGARDQV